MQILYIINSYPGNAFSFEAPRSKLRGIFDRKEVCYFQIRSLTPQQAAGNALAFAVQTRSKSINDQMSIECIIAKMTNLGTELLFDALVKSLLNLSFRAKREILCL